MPLVRRATTALRILLTQGPVALAHAVLRFLRRRPLPAMMDECEIVFHALDASRVAGTMVDVGAHHGTTLLPFANAGWQVLALEPDARNRGRLEEATSTLPNVTVESRAASDHAESGVPFFRSDVSTGISGLSAFDPSHFAADRVELATLDTIMRDHRIDRIDFLKIDTEGFDLMVLKGLPWDRVRPTVIVCEFEDAKTAPLGYSHGDLAQFLVDRGYGVLVSEWHPIVRYGMAHSWARMREHPAALLQPTAWGNFVACCDSDTLARLRARFEDAAAGRSA